MVRGRPPKKKKTASTETSTSSTAKTIPDFSPNAGRSIQNLLANDDIRLLRGIAVFGLLIFGRKPDELTAAERPYTPAEAVETIDATISLLA